MLRHRMLAIALLTLAALATVPAAIPAQHRGASHIDEAVRYYGHNPARLRPAQRAAIDHAIDELFPGSRRRRQTLNRAQATAAVYMALVYPTERAGGPGRVVGPPPRRDACTRVERLAYDMENVLNGGSSLFVGDHEKRQIRSLAVEAQRGAVDCRNHAAADAAGDVLQSLSPSLPSRSTVARHVRDLKLALRDDRW
jgi:hypothetical protein